MNIQAPTIQAILCEDGIFQVVPVSSEGIRADQQSGLAKK
jgi:hypothetical protein